MRTLNLQYWKLYTSDKWILETVQGYKIEFSEIPFQDHIPIEIPFPTDQALLVSQEVTNLLNKGAIEVVPPSDDQFISTIFSSPGPKGQVSFCHHFSSVVRPSVVRKLPSKIRLL